MNTTLAKYQKAIHANLLRESEQLNLDPAIAVPYCAMIALHDFTTYETAQQQLHTFANHWKNM